jgi:succinate dehydrogenase / fumarate reductase iron-sulfur subunit
VSEKRKFRIWRGTAAGGAFHEYEVETEHGMVVLDAVHRIQAEHANDLAVRWNCKAGKCGSCSCEINGRPRLSCMTRLNVFEPGEAITVQPLKAFPVIKDLVTDVSWNYRQNERITPFTPRPRDPDGHYRMQQDDVERVQEFRKCIECFLCQDVCHVLRDHERKDAFAGPRFMIRLAGLDMHPLDTVDRIPAIKGEHGVGLCNITRCCTEVCPEHIGITDNGIIPLKERVVDRFYDPIARLLRVLGGGARKTAPPAPAAPAAPPAPPAG